LSRQRQELRERTVTIMYSQHCPVYAVPGITFSAEITASTTRIDLTNDSLSDLRLDGRPFNNTDELMTENSGK